MNASREDEAGETLPRVERARMTQPVRTSSNLQATRFAAGLKEFVGESADVGGARDKSQRQCFAPSAAGVYAAIISPN